MPVAPRWFLLVYQQPASHFSSINLPFSTHRRPTRLQANPCAPLVPLGLLGRAGRRLTNAGLSLSVKRQHGGSGRPGLRRECRSQRAGGKAGLPSRPHRAAGTGGRLAAPSRAACAPARPPRPPPLGGAHDPAGSTRRGRRRQPACPATGQPRPGRCVWRCCCWPLWQPQLALAGSRHLAKVSPSIVAYRTPSEDLAHWAATAHVTPSLPSGQACPTCPILSDSHSMCSIPHCGLQGRPPACGACCRLGRQLTPARLLGSPCQALAISQTCQPCPTPPTTCQSGCPQASPCPCHQMQW